jgi:hypothetical protein
MIQPSKKDSQSHLIASIERPSTIYSHDWEIITGEGTRRQIHDTIPEQESPLLKVELMRTQKTSTN